MYFDITVIKAKFCYFAFFYIFGLLITKHHMWNDVEYLYKMWYNYVKLLGNKNLMERNFITN